MDLHFCGDLCKLRHGPPMPPKKKNFETDRTRQFRSRALDEEDERTISHIEEFGCSIVLVRSTTSGPGWSYTVGVYDTSGSPEIITVGLKEETAQSLLNEAARQLRAAPTSLKVGTAICSEKSSANSGQSIPSGYNT